MKIDFDIAINLVSYFKFTYIVPSSEILMIHLNFLNLEFSVLKYLFNFDGSPYFLSGSQIAYYEGTCQNINFTNCTFYWDSLISLQGLIVSSFVAYRPPTYGSYTYPESSVAFGTIISVIPIVPIFVFAFIAVKNAEGQSIKEVRFINYTAIKFNNN